MKTMCVTIISLISLLRMKSFFLFEKLWRKIKTQIVSSLKFSENLTICEIMRKKNKIHCCVSAPTVVMRKRHNVMLHVHRLSCPFLWLAHQTKSASRFLDLTYTHTEPVGLLWTSDQLVV